MTCLSCAEAEKNAATHFFNANCLECETRAIAHGQDYYRSKQSNRITLGYRSALACVFGADINRGHEAVKVWADRIKQARSVPQETPDSTAPQRGKSADTYPGTALGIGEAETAAVLPEKVSP